MQFIVSTEDAHSIDVFRGPSIQSCSKRALNHFFVQLRRVEAAISFSGNGHLAPVFYVRLVIDMATSKLTYQEKQGLIQ